MKKIFGGIDLTWKKIIISAIIIGIVIGLTNDFRIFASTSITDISIFFDWWILAGVIIIMNSKSNLDSALKCFVFFLISQPLIYLVQVPVSHLHWQIFSYYKLWFIWTLLCLPMGYLGYCIKKDKWWAIIFLIPMMLLTAVNIGTHYSNMLFDFPKHIISFVFCLVMPIIYPIGMFQNKKVRIVGAILGIVMSVSLLIYAILNPSTYKTQPLCSGDTIEFDKTFKVSLKDPKYGTVKIIEYDEDDFYCVEANFKKAGKTELIMESKEGEKTIFDLIIYRSSYSIDKKE